MRAAVSLRAALAALSVLAISCSSVPEPVPGRDYTVTTRADDQSRAFLIDVESSSDVPLCFSTLDWPNVDGRWLGYRGLFELHSADGNRTTAETDPGSCVGARCIERIDPGGRQSAKLSYAVFGDPAEIAALRNKELKYNLVASHCPS